MKLVTLGDRLFNPDAIDAIVPVDGATTLVALRGGESFTVYASIRMVRDQLVRQQLLTDPLDVG